MAEDIKSTGETPEEKIVAKPKSHKVFGLYTKCSISYKQPNKENVDVFASVNTYVLECKQDVEVMVPIEIIKHLKAATYQKFVFDAKTKKDVAIPMKKYNVEIL